MASTTFSRPRSGFPEGRGPRDEACPCDRAFRRRTLRGLPSVAIAAALVLVLPARAGAGDGQPFSSERVDFSVKVKDVVTAYSVLGLFVLPAEALDLEIVRPTVKDGFRLVSQGREIRPIKSGHWSWLAPRSEGLHVLTIQPPDGSAVMTFNVFVMLPFSSLRNGRIRGYRIGYYPTHPKNERAAYFLPRGFIEVTPDVEEVRVSPHFRLKQFLCKQAGGHPKYVILLERLLLKLELILENANRNGLRADTFHVMSGYRTPFYNAVLGNVVFSMHQWGGAADIFIDEDPVDGTMDDLNGDHAIDVKDAQVLHRIVETMDATELATSSIGGLGLYGPTSSHGPFIHVDVRGFRARW